MNVKQKTIKSDISFEGAGLHTGQIAHLTLRPAPENSGIRFIRVDLPHKPIIKISPENLDIPTGILRCTTIGQESATIHTVEHLMSAFCGLGITNCDVEIDSGEIPGLDGSAKVFAETILKTGVVEQDACMLPFRIVEPIGVEHNGSAIYIVPADDFKVSYTLSYDNPFLKSQFFTKVINQDSYLSDVAPCRTFCLEKEAQQLRASGFGKGANFANTLVIGDNGPVDNVLRFPDECARHKVLDLIGDLYLLGVPILGHVYATKSGHALNLALLRKIYEQQQRFLRKEEFLNFCYEGKKELNINDIMKILPHRYPFLLIDRVIEIEKGKKAVGIKNVTINDDFFQGHFPSQPIMPGVLMVEAMAQTGGVVVLTSEAHHGKVAFFMAVDKVKFRKLVIPGDQLVMEVEVIRDKSKFVQLQGTARVNGEVVCEAEMLLSFVDASFIYH